MEIMKYGKRRGWGRKIINRQKKMIAEKSGEKEIRRKEKMNNIMRQGIKRKVDKRITEESEGRRKGEKRGERWKK